MHPDLQRIVDAIKARTRFIVSSHERPDGDAIGSGMAAAYALRAMGKEAVVISADAPAPPLMLFPGVPEIIVSREAPGDFDAAIIMECGDLARTGVSGLDRSFVINIDHHPGNSNYGQLNWFDGTAAACGEMVFDLVRALGVTLTPEIATHIYLAILTDTGSFHFSNITPRTFEQARVLVEAGVDPVLVARNVYDSNSMSRLRLFGAVLGGMEIDPSGRIATLYVDHAMTRAAEGTYDDTEGLINQPLTVKDVQAVAFFKQVNGDDYRVSLRSKGNVDIGSIAKAYGGGGHKNAAGCSASGDIRMLKAAFVGQMARAIDGRPADR